MARLVAGSHEPSDMTDNCMIAKFRCQPVEFDVQQLARATDALMGSEIEQLSIDLLHEAFSRRSELTDRSIDMLLNEFVPLTKLMGEQIHGRTIHSRHRLPHHVAGLRDDDQLCCGRARLWSGFIHGSV